MPDRRLRKTEVRRTLVDWDYITSEPDADDIVCIQLTKGQRRLISAALHSHRSSVRWVGDLPNVYAPTEYIDAIEAALDGEVCNVPITDMRVENCTLEVQYDGGPTWVAIGQFFPLDASCIITGTTKIHIDSEVATEFIHLRQNTAAPNANVNQRIRFEAKDSTGAYVENAMIAAAWGAINEGRINFNIRAASARRRVYSIIGSPQILHEFLAWTAASHQYFMLLRGEITQSQILTAMTGGVEKLIHYATGLTRLRVDNAATNAPVTGLIVDARLTAGTPAAGFGVDVQLQGNTTLLGAQVIGDMQGTWSNATHATRKGMIALRAADGATMYKGVEVGADGAPTIGFLGASPIARRTHDAANEFEAIEEINATLAAFGLIVDNTTVVPDEGGGGGFVPTTELIQEIYRDFVQFPHGLFPFLDDTDWGVWTPNVGWEQGVSGFRIQQNFNAGIEILWVRIAFTYIAGSAFDLWIGLDRDQNTEVTIAEIPVPVSAVFDDITLVFPVFVRPDTTAPFQIWVLGTLIPVTDYQIIVTSLDIVVRGLASLETDFLQIEEDQTPPHRIVRYVDPVEEPLYVFSENPGGTTPPALEIDPQ